jgi:AAA domain
VISGIEELLKKPPFLTTIYTVAASCGGFYILIWPTSYFHGDARWYGLGLWVGILLSAAFIGLMSAVWAEDDRAANLGEKTTQPKISQRDLEADRSAFKEQVNKCFSDRRIAGYFIRRLVQHDDAMKALAHGDAFNRALEVDSYGPFAASRAELQYIINSNSTLVSNGVYNGRTVATFVGALLLIALSLTEVTETTGATLGITLLSLVFGGWAGWIWGTKRDGPRLQPRMLIAFTVAMSASLSAIISSYILINADWTPLTLYPIWITVFALCCLVSNTQTFDQCLSLLVLGYRRVTLFLTKRKVSRLQAQWLDDCIDDIIMPHAILIINTTLGKDKDRLLVEQDSDGLRRLQDPIFTVPTKSESRTASILTQMDGGSIALAGPRGAGKSTLLRKYTETGRANVRDEPCISVYLTAPAEYVPRDFLAELFQQLCVEYLRYKNCPLPEPMYKERRKPKLRNTFVRMWRILILSLRAAIAIAAIYWLVRPELDTHYHQICESTFDAFKDWYDHAYRYLYKKEIKPGWPAIIRIPAAIFLCFVFFPGPRKWKGHLRSHKEPELARRAREYLFRLQVDKTVTWGGSLNSSIIRGFGLSLNKGGSASYTPWTLPELVGHIRRFMQDISSDFSNSSHAIIVGIDEIDRIGSLDHAEKFIGEIKAIFGVEKCFFLVSVAEDVGSVFAQRATAGRSILENAFDDIVIVAPLDFEETRDLLLKRVPGFTDSFAYLVHALSGGLPRELIRVTRRLVDVNQELSGSSRQPRLENLTIALVKEELVEAIRATRSQLSRLTLHGGWPSFFEDLRSASVSLHHASPFSVQDSYYIIKELSELTVPEIPKEETGKWSSPNTDEDRARRVAADFVAFSYFGITVIDAFSEKFFDFQRVQKATARGSVGSYEELSVARAELTVSSETSRVMLHQFRSSVLRRPASEL